MERGVRGLGRIVYECGRRGTWRREGEDDGERGEWVEELVIGGWMLNQKKLARDEGVDTPLQQNQLDQGPTMGMEGVVFQLC